MCRVLVVCSVHSTKRASPDELHWLLTCLGPEALFLEHAATDIDSFRDGSCGSLESLAVLRYLRNRDATLVPVDIDLSSFELPAEELKAQFDELFHMATEASPRLKGLHESHARETDAGGFAYLNSPLGWRREIEIRRELCDSVAAIGAPRVLAAYELFERLNNRRELAIIDGVEAFARSVSFKQGVLLVGSAHRQPLIDKLQHPASRRRSNLEWLFEWELTEPLPFTGHGSE